MLTSEKTLLLDKLLGKQKEHYLTWEALRSKLDKKGREKFGLNAKSLWAELKSAVEPFLGQEMMFSEHFGQWYLSFKRPLEALRAKIASGKTAELKSLLDKHKTKEKRSYLKSNTTLLKLFGLGTKTDPGASALEKIIAPCLGTELMLLKKKPATARAKETLYLAYNKPLTQFVVESFQVQSLKKPFKFKSIADDVPISLAEFVALFNQMLAAGQFQVTKIDDKFGITGLKLADGNPPPVPISLPSPGQNDYDLFQAAFDKLDGGRIYVRICNMRRELGWSEERFNTLLRKLRADGVIQLHAGDVSTMTENDVNQSYTDENNFFYATISWRKR